MLFGRFKILRDEYVMHPRLQKHQSSNCPIRKLELHSICVSHPKPHALALFLVTLSLLN